MLTDTQAILELRPLDRNSSAAVHRAAAELLCPAELSRARAMADAPAVDFLAGRLTQRHFAAHLLGVPPSELTASYTCPDCGSGPHLSHGRPGYMLDGGPAPLILSVSRAAGWLLLAAVVNPEAGQLLGVDLEAAAGTDFDRFDDVALTSREREHIAATPADARSAERARLWARKEAWLKATGRGLRLDPDAVDVLDRQFIGDCRVRDLRLLEFSGGLQVPHGLVGALVC